MEANIRTFAEDQAKENSAVGSEADHLEDEDEEKLSLQLQKCHGIKSQVNISDGFDTTDFVIGDYEQPHVIESTIRSSLQANLIHGWKQISYQIVTLGVYGEISPFNGSYKIINHHLPSE